ncbi:hypothetical protein Poli38472_005711 [Pythium oligandrum]|uniref:RCC1-like domain-containing protein n=1 Tax=Pythium oligandrum TaxID=41045 RepID=A0A8K1CTZ9_PYTOL|nr:hypothetical protein Poli38472_005711 [Pythium oligandrum]|eukprot:TMW68243.1 hypothetical protein Poli38472_005711 [Pythium oligandrum]
MPVELPTDIDAFHAVLRRRVRDQDAIDGFHVAAIEGGGSTQSGVAMDRNVEPPRHVVGQTGCFCADCLLHRKQEWRIGDINTGIVGPRDQWRQYVWGNTERGVLGAVDSELAQRQPVLTPSVCEKVVVHDSKQQRLPIERDAKFISVASGSYHTLLLSESGGVFACGDNTHGALGLGTSKSTLEIPTRINLPATETLNGDVRMVATSGYASFALVRMASSQSQRQQGDSTEQEKKPPLNRRRSIEEIAMGHMKQDETRSRPICNYVFSWGRGDHGILGRGDTASSALPQAIDVFNTINVLEISAGFRHVLVLTEADGVFSFGDGTNGKLGHGDTVNRFSPAKVQALSGIHVIRVSAGDEHSIAVTGESFFNRQVYSWGLGLNGQLGHGDEQPRLKPTRINHFRGRKVISAVAGGSHNIATSEMTDGICVWSWGFGAYGQLGHRGTWDIFVPRSIDEIRRECIRHIDAGVRHSLAISDSQQLWVWGKGIHGPAELDHPDPTSSCIVQPVKVDLPGLQIIAAAATRERTFVWGDRVLEKREKVRGFGESIASAVCSSCPEYASLTSDAFRILYRCGTCQLFSICIGCAHKCHIQHCLELGWTLENALSRDCDCFSAGKCTFDQGDGAEAVLTQFGDDD